MPLRSLPTIRTRVINARWSASSTADSSAERRRPFRGAALRELRRLAPNVAIKVDYQDYGNGAGTGIDQLNVALGYLF